MNNDTQIPQTEFEKIADRFFEFPVKLLYKFLDGFFEYTYQETKRGIFGLFDSPEKISSAAKAARDKGLTGFDCLTPFPVHGLEFDMGLNRSKIPYITFFAGITGLIISFMLQFAVHENVLPVTISRFFDAYPNLNSYPMNFGGKPTYSWPAMIPICFELTVLLGGHTTVIGMLLMSRIPRPSRRILHPDITNDKFCLWIPDSSKSYSEEGMKKFLSELGAKNITVVKENS